MSEWIEDDDDDSEWTVSKAQYRLSQMKVNRLTAAIRLELMRMAVRMRQQENPK